MNTQTKRSISVISSGEYDQKSLTTAADTYEIQAAEPSASLVYGWKAFPEEWTAEYAVCPCGTV